MSTTLTLRREAFGIELRRGRFEAVLDGDPVASLDRSEAVEMPLAPGHHTLRIREGRYSSRERDFDAVDGDEVTFLLHGVLIWPMWVASVVKPDLGIALKRVDPPKRLDGDPEGA